MFSKKEKTFINDIMTMNTNSNKGKSTASTEDLSSEKFYHVTVMMTCGDLKSKMPMVISYFLEGPTHNNEMPAFNSQH